MTTLKVKGMSCNHCVMAVTKALSEISELKDIRVDLGKGEVSFEEAKPVSQEVIRKKILESGYDVD